MFVVLTLIRHDVRFMKFLGSCALRMRACRSDCSFLKEIISKNVVGRHIPNGMNKSNTGLGQI